MILENFVTITYLLQNEPQTMNYKETVKLIQPIEVSFIEANPLCKIIFTNKTGIVLENFRFYFCNKLIFFQKKIFPGEKLILKNPKDNKNPVISYNFYKNRKRESIYYFVPKFKNKK